MRKQALLIVDMQEALFSTPPYDADGLISRINDLSARMRTKQFPVIFVQHCGPEGNALHPSQPGHALHSELVVKPGDKMISKMSCDCFLSTGLGLTLVDLEVDELVITGFATDFCVDTTVRSALAHGYPTTVPKDGHTTSDRPYMSASLVIQHHNFVWANLISPVGAAHLTSCDAIA
jgi:nicotinamidase-related amidase